MTTPDEALRWLEKVTPSLLPGIWRRVDDANLPGRLSENETVSKAWRMYHGTGLPAPGSIGVSADWSCWMTAHDALKSLTAETAPLLDLGINELRLMARMTKNPVIECLCFYALARHYELDYRTQKAIRENREFIAKIRDRHNPI